jgi:hypothetical protein
LSRLGRASGGRRKSLGERRRLAEQDDAQGEVIFNGEEEGREEEGHEEEGCEEEEVSRLSGPGTSSGDWSAIIVGQSPTAWAPFDPGVPTDSLLTTANSSFVRD